MLEIRAMRPEDQDAVVRIIEAHHEVDGKLADEYYEEYFADPVRVSSAREANFVGLEGDVVVGVTGHYPDKYDWPTILWLNWHYVHPEYRRRGIGTKLLAYVVDLAKKQGIRKLYLDTGSETSYAAAVRLYEKFGFQEEGRLLDYYGDGEHYLIMGLEL